jgi:hypothetical protein
MPHPVFLNCVICHDTLLGVPKTHSALQGSVVAERSWNTHMMNTVTCSWLSVPVIVELVLLHGQARCVILVDVIQALKCFGDCSNVSVRQKCNTYSTCECRSPTDFTDTSQWRFLICSCGTRAVEKFTWCPTRIGSIPVEDPRSTLWRWISFIPLLVERTSLSKRLSSMDGIWRMAMTSKHCGSYPFYITFCGKTKYFLPLRICPKSTTVISGHRTILTLSANVGVKSASVSAFGLESSETLSWAPNFYMTGWLLNDIMIFC